MQTSVRPMYNYGALMFWPQAHKLLVTVLGSKSTAEADPRLQMLMIVFIPEGTRLGCTAAILVTFIGIREN